VSATRQVKISQAFLRFNKVKIIGVLAGFIISIVWILPVWHAPEQQLRRELSEPLRAARLLIPAVIATMVALFTGRKRFLRVVDGLGAVILVLLPNIMWIFSDDSSSDFFVTNMTLFLSAVTLVGVSCWPTGALKSFWTGCGLILTMFVLARLFTFGVEFGTFYGRPRLHLGFDHPLMTASAILTISIAMIISINNSRALWFKYFFNTLTIVATIYVLRAVDSRNSTLFGLALVLFSLLLSVLPGFVIKLILVGMLPVLFLLVSVLSVYAGSGAKIIGNFQSIAERFSAWGVAISDLTQGGLSSVHPSANRDTFAIFDSLYTTFGFRFGLLGMVLLCIWLQIICTKQIRRRPTTAIDMLGFSGASAAAIFFFGDTQGITAANLAVFMTLATSYRRAVN
jgi:hypothetical protein